jgi:hypothetical protein
MYFNLKYRMYFPNTFFTALHTSLATILICYYRYKCIHKRIRKYLLLQSDHATDQRRTVRADGLRDFNTKSCVNSTSFMKEIYKSTSIIEEYLTDKLNLGLCLLGETRTLFEI